MGDNIITISVEDVKVDAAIGNNATAQKILNALPLDGRVNRWGEEIYFSIPVHAEQEPEARADVEIGELAYWPVGKAFCIFFGPTPVSVDEKPRAYSPVNVFGRILGDASVLKNVSDNATIRVAQKQS
jgi:hypothetical protein